MGRVRLSVRGAVQGVGFRPYIYRMAVARGLAGWVANGLGGVTMEVEGAVPALRDFLGRLEAEKPPRASIHGVETSWLDPAGYDRFEIRASESSGDRTALVLPDIATCVDCLKELFDPADRRYLYPFTNCTHCGPRFSIIEALPYDRANTSMRVFTMCSACQREYDDPANRRFHAQPNACPDCGPALELMTPAGNCLAAGLDALDQAAQALLKGALVAVKGIGGFQLMCLAAAPEAVTRLRERKHREEKPFAVMCPSLAAAGELACLSAEESRLLGSPEAPIVLVRRRPDSVLRLAANVAPDNPYLGLLLPYSPLHHLLLGRVRACLVCTSGNLSDEPICTENPEALDRLGSIADLFLTHNRPIVRQVDDSVARVVLGRELLLRRARGYAPWPVANTDAGSATVLALGAHLKNSVALAHAGQVHLGQHIGDLDNEPSYVAFRRVTLDLCRLQAAAPVLVAVDLHPDYLSSRFGEECVGRWAAPTSGGPVLRSQAGPLLQVSRGESGRLPLVRVQHHLAHAWSCLAENEVELPALGLAWDGTGLGTDGTIWGGEFFDITAERMGRLARFRMFPLPGGDRAVKEPRRAALGLLWAAQGPGAFDRVDLPTLRAFAPGELRPLRQALEQRVNAPFTGSVGRLFDAVASLCGLRQLTRFEGQAAMALEYALDEPSAGAPGYAFSVSALPDSEAPDTPRFEIDWGPMLRELLGDVTSGARAALISARFHHGLVRALLELATRAGRERVALSGGCFQNVYLLEQAIGALRRAGFKPYWHQRVPPNDGGISVGQAVAALRATV